MSISPPSRQITSSLDTPTRLARWLTLCTGTRVCPAGCPCMSWETFLLRSSRQSISPRFLAVARGGVGGLTVYNSPDLDAIEAAGLYEVYYPRGYAWEHIDLNMTKFPLDDVRVRQALFHAIDREALVEQLYFGKQSTTDLPVPPGLSWAYTENYTKYPYDPERAKELLAEAGWDCSVYPGTNADGHSLESTFMTTDRLDRQEL